jgi:hypothetical protein
LFYNTQLEDDLPGYREINPDGVTWGQVVKLLKRGEKLNLLPPTYPEKKEKLLAGIVQRLFDSGFTKINPMYLAVDEVHLYDEKTVLPELIRVATGGMKFGIRGVWISQRPALIPNTLMTQSVRMLMFPCNMETQYFKRYGIPYDEIEQELIKNGEFSYVSYDFRNIEAYTNSKSWPHRTLSGS